MATTVSSLISVVRCPGFFWWNKVDCHLRVLVPVRAVVKSAFAENYVDVTDIKVKRATSSPNFRVMTV